MLIKSLIISLAFVAFSFQQTHIRQDDGSYLSSQSPQEFIELWDKLYFHCPHEVDQIFYESIGVSYEEFRDWYVNLPDHNYPRYYPKRKKNIVLCETLE
jgi:hypothetical protein